MREIDFWQSFVKLSLPIDHPGGYCNENYIQYEMDWRQLVEFGSEPLPRDNSTCDFIVKLAKMYNESADIEALTDPLPFLLRSAVFHYAELIDYFVYRNSVKVSCDRTVIAYSGK